MSKKITVGLIGAGRIGRVHGENLSFRIPDANLVAVADVFKEVADKTAADLRIPTAYTNYQQILEDETIEGVVICSSTDTHSQIIEEAASAGKHIFCEKPIDHDLVKVNRVLKVVEEAGIKFQVGFNRRFDPNFRRVREIVAAGDIGDPHILRITSRDPEPPPVEYVKVSGGIFLDMTIHDFDMARFLINSEIEEVYAVGGVMIDPEIGKAGDIDTAVITLCYENGVIGTIDNSRQAVYGYDQRVEVFGSEGVVMVSNNKPDSAVVSNVNGDHSSNPLFFFVERYTESYIAEMKEFIECVQQDKTPSVTGIDGLVPVVIGHAAKKSLDENRPIKISEIS